MNIQSNESRFVKLLILGSEESGKTTLISTLTKKFSPPEDQNKPYCTGYRLSNCSNKMSLNVFEVSLLEEDEEKYKKDIFLACIFQCQCALFLIDSTSEESFTIFQSQISKLLSKSKDYTTIAVVLTKVDSPEKTISIEQVNNHIISLKSPKIKKLFEFSKDKNDKIKEINNFIYDVLYHNNKNDLVVNYINELKGQMGQINKDLKKKTQDIVRVLMLGDTTVGKTALMQRFFRGTFSDQYFQSVGVAEQNKCINCNGNIVQLSLWDTVGQFRFEALPRQYYKNPEGMLLLFDVSKRDTFQGLDKWIESIKENGKSNQTVYIVGNKIDCKERDVTREEAMNYAKEKGLKYFEISCKLNLNVNELVMELAGECLAKLKRHSSFISLVKLKEEKKKKGMC